MNRNWKEIEVDDNSTVWDRENPIEGRLVKIDEKVGPNESKMYTIDTEDGEVKVWGSTVLDDRLMSVPTGTYVKIDYEGRLKGAKGNFYHAYRVFIDLDDVEADKDPKDQSGYDKAKTIRDSIGKDEKEDEPIDIEEIPF